MASERRNDPALVRAASEGSELAFSSLYRAYVRPVFWLAYGVLQHTADAEEVTQETFVTAWRKLRGLHLESDSLLPWLATICRFQVANRIRLRQKEREHMAGEADDTLPSTVDIEQQVVTTELVREILNEVQGLSDIDREIFRLVAAEGYGYQAAADELGVSHGVVRNRLSRMRTRLRARTEEIS